MKEMNKKNTNEQRNSREEHTDSEPFPLSLVKDMLQSRNEKIKIKFKSWIGNGEERRNGIKTFYYLKNVCLFFRRLGLAGQRASADAILSHARFQIHSEHMTMNISILNELHFVT